MTTDQLRSLVPGDTAWYADFSVDESRPQIYMAVRPYVVEVSQFSPVRGDHTLTFRGMRYVEDPENLHRTRAEAVAFLQRWAADLAESALAAARRMDGSPPDSEKGSPLGLAPDHNSDEYSGTDSVG